MLYGSNMFQCSFVPCGLYTLQEKQFVPPVWPPHGSPFPARWVQMSMLTPAAAELLTDTCRAALSALWSVLLSSSSLCIGCTLFALCRIAHEPRLCHKQCLSFPHVDFEDEHRAECGIERRGTAMKIMNGTGLKERDGDGRGESRPTPGAVGCRLSIRTLWDGRKIYTELWCMEPTRGTGWEKVTGFMGCNLCLWLHRTAFIFWGHCIMEYLWVNAADGSQNNKEPECFAFVA